MRVVPFLLTAASLAAQASWTQAAPPIGPGARTNTASASNLGGHYVFGGNLGGGVTTNELWHFDGLTWNLNLPANLVPPPRMQLGAEFDPQRSRLVIFGGYDGASFLGDTWEWDGVTWSRPILAASPSARRWHDLAYDSIRNRVVLFGGWDGTQNFNDTWEFDGSAWNQVATANAPSPRARQAMAFDSSRGTVVIFGGQVGTSTTAVLGDTWSYDGVDWTQQTPATTPGGNGLVQAVMAFDSYRERLVLAAGYNVTYQDRTYEWDGADWLDRGVTAGLARAGAAMDFVLATGKTTVFGGFVTGPGFLADTWEYQTNAMASYAASGSGCAGPAGTPALMPRGLPWVGDSFEIHVSNLQSTSLPFMLLGLSATAWSGGPLPFTLAAFGAPNCSLLVSPDAATLVLAPSGTAQWVLAIPPDPALAGVRFFNQLLAIEPLGSSFQITATRLGSALVGLR